MPSRVPFFRSQSDSFDFVRPDKSTVRKRSAQTPDQADLHTTLIDAIMPLMPEKRRSVAPTTGRNSPKGSSKAVPQVKRALLHFDVESPPLVFYGTSANSTGALLGGQIKLDVVDKEMVIDSFQMKLVISVKMKKPFHAHCPECAHQATDLTTWDFHKKGSPKTLEKGEHSYPFSFLLPGHLPASMHGSLSVVDYVLKAIVTPTTGDPIFLQRELPVARAILPSELPKQSIRIFPPTNLTAHVELPSVIYPIGEFKCSFRIDGVISRNTELKTQTQWRLKRLSWRLEETQKVISPACPKHAAKAGAAPDEKKGMAHTDVRTLNSEEMKSGWKCDYGLGAEGSIEMEFPFSCRNNLNPQCDVKAADGTEVFHSLIIEMIVAEEFAQFKRITQAVPTGAARVLRMHFNTTITERSGLGISWDEEQPPMYDDVPASPPRYVNAHLLETGQPIPEYQELDSLPSTGEVASHPNGEVASRPNGEVVPSTGMIIDRVE